MELLHGDLSSLILKAFYSTYTILPYGLDKSFYVNTLLLEMKSLGLSIEENKKHKIFHKENLIGEINLDVVVNNLIVLKIDNLKGFIEVEQIDQNKVFLKMTNYEVLLLLNFGIELEHKRIFMTNDFKKIGDSK